MKIYISSDHGGFEMKNYLIAHQNEIGVEFEDLGPYELNHHDDYPDFATALGEKVASEANAAGVLICRNGNGVCIAANKVKGVRAGLSWTSFHSRSLKNDDNTNVLCLSADFLENEKALEIIGTWVTTPYSDEPRHNRRIQKIADYEAK